MITPTHSVEPAPPAASAIRWYQGVTRAQWLILLIASASWIFDSYAGQIFNVTRSVMLPGLLDMSPADPSVKFWGEVFLGDRAHWRGSWRDLFRLAFGPASAGSRR
jgi:hypothetical protein